MNKQQREYAVAKAAAEAADRQQVENEKRFILEKGIKNPDGSIPATLWLIDDENIFTQLCEEWDNSPLNIIGEVKAKAAALKTAEDALIDYALSITPKSIADTLNKHRRDYNTRRKMLDIAFRLDTKTVK